MQAKAMSQELAEAYEPFAGPPPPLILVPHNLMLSQRLACATAVEADEVASRSYALVKIPQKLQADFDQMRDHRTRILNRFRSGSAVVDTTFEHDVSSTLRYCGWLTGSHGPGFDGELSLLGVFGHTSVGAHVESYLQWCMDERKCMASSCANYASGLCASIAAAQPIAREDTTC
jgi:hypothetical protein